MSKKLKFIYYCDINIKYVLNIYELRLKIFVLKINTILEFNFN